MLNWRSFPQRWVFSACIKMQSYVSFETKICTIKLLFTPNWAYYFCFIKRGKPDFPDFLQKKSFIRLSPVLIRSPTASAPEGDAFLCVALIYSPVNVVVVVRCLPISASAAPTADIYFYVLSSVTRLGDFWKFLAIHFCPQKWPEYLTTF